MSDTQPLAAIRYAVQGRILSHAVYVAALVAPERVGFAGKALKGEKPTGYLFDDEMGIEPDDELRFLPASWKASGISALVGTNPSAILAWREGDGIRAFLYATHVDATGNLPMRAFRYDDGARGWLGALVVTRREILADGTLGPVTEQATDLIPGERPKPNLPDEAPSTDPMGNVLGMALNNLAEVLTADFPTDRQVAAWMKANPAACPSGSDPVGDAAPAAPPKPRHKAPKAPKPPKLRIDLGKLAERIEALHRPVYLPVMREVQDGDPNGMSGRPGLTFIPEGTKWPEAKGQTLRQVAQLDVASLPEEAAALLGGKGLFQFFVGAEYDDRNEAWLARVVDPAGPGSWQAGPEGSDAPRLVVTGWERRVEAPHCQDLTEGPTSVLGRRIPETMLEALDFLGPDTYGQPRLPQDKVVEAARENGADPALAERVAAATEHHDGNKLLGWPTWSQGPEWQGGARKPMRFLFQFALGEPVNGMGLATDVLASDGHAQVFVSDDGKLRFGFAWACG